MIHYPLRIVADIAITDYEWNQPKVNQLIYQDILDKKDVLQWRDLYDTDKNECTRGYGDIGTFLSAFYIDKLVHTRFQMYHWR
jgi:hypothetical protein